MSQGQDSNSDVMKDADRLLLAAYRDASTDLPSTQVDDALRAAARRAVGARPRAPSRFRLGNWNTPLAAAATVVLSATVVFMVMRDHGTDELATPPSPAPAVRLHTESSTAPADVPMSAEPAASPSSVAPAVVQTPAVLPSAPDAQERIAAPGAGAPAEFPDDTASAQVRGSAPLPAASQAVDITEPLTVNSREAMHAPVPPSSGLPAQKLGNLRAQPAEVSQAAPRSAAQSPSLAVGEARQPVPASAERAPQSRARMSSPSSLEASSPSVLPGPSLDAESRRGEEDRAVGHDQVDLARKESASAALAMDRRASKNAAPVSPAPDGATRGAQSPQVEEQVERIRALLRVGKRAEALTALAALRSAYPDYPLPADLSELAKALPAASR